ncbi:MAG: butyrate kinase [Candidatus Glassbacteria bacterium]|nr:butyrate kinase [Candidatus Glassbacteria bacterium]
MRTPLIFVINPGSTSTKLAVFKGLRRRLEWSHSHLRENEVYYSSMKELAGLRTAGILEDLAVKGYHPGDFDLAVARGGLLKPLRGGVYRVNRKMVEDLAACIYGRHLSNLGAIMAQRMVAGRGGKAYVVNPVVVDELAPVARISGLPAIARRSIFHALNQKAIAARVASRLGKDYRSARLIVVHAGGGVSVGAHLDGKVVDVNNALEGEGPFSPERSGGLPLLDFLRYVMDNGLDLHQAQHLITRNSGLAAYLGTKDCREIERRVREGDPRARLCYRAFVYQVAREIGALAASVFNGRVDAVVLSGGIAAGGYFRRWLKKHVGFLGPVYAFPRTGEMEALAAGGWEVWMGKTRARTYR